MKHHLTQVCLHGSCQYDIRNASVHLIFNETGKCFVYHTDKGIAFCRLFACTVMIDQNIDFYSKPIYIWSDKALNYWNNTYLLIFLSQKLKILNVHAIYCFVCDRDWIYGVWKCENSKAYKGFSEEAKQKFF